MVHEALERLLDHGRRGKLGPLWDAALDEAERRLHSLQGATAGEHAQNPTVIKSSAEQTRPFSTR